MAFLRSIARGNQSLVVSRKFSSSSIRSSVQRRNVITPTFSRVELLACQQYYLDLRRELNTKKTEPDGKSSMSTLAAHKVSTSSGAASASIQNSNDPPPQRDPLDVSFNDPIAAFKSKTTWELARAYFVYLMCSSEYLVENNMKVNE